jgi:cation:H+ antiporter
VWHVALLLVCAAAIYLACEWFVNAVEWLGSRLRVGRMAVGTILAALGTALPESVVTLVAVTTGGTAQARQIGIGAAMGGPLALSTVAYGVAGATLLITRRRARRKQAQAPALATVGARRISGEAAAAPAGRAREQDPARSATGEPGGRVLTGAREAGRLARDQRWFVAVFVVKLALGLVAFAIKPWLGLAFFATYLVYFAREIRGGHDEGQPSDGSQAGGEETSLAPLKSQPRRESPASWVVVTQTLVSLVVIFVASEVFVDQIEVLGPMLGLSAAVTALLLSPIATELPEVANAIIWIRQGKTSLALANISGAMMIQATVPAGLGILFTDWRFGPALTWSGIITLAAIGYLLVTLWTHRLTPARLAGAGLGYAVFGAGLAFLLA